MHLCVRDILKFESLNERQNLLLLNSESFDSEKLLLYFPGYDEKMIEPPPTEQQNNRKNSNENHRKNDSSEVLRPSSTVEYSDIHVIEVDEVPNEGKSAIEIRIRKVGTTSIFDIDIAPLHAHLEIKLLQEISSLFHIENISSDVLI